MNNRVKEAVMASFVGDSLALGVHWIYNTRVIDQKYGRVKGFLAPELAVFHKGRPKGGFTHYGDQTFLFLKSLSQDGDSKLYFLENWVKLMESGACYLDEASKATLANLVAGLDGDEAGSSSTDLGGAARIAPLLLLPYESASELIDAARAHAGLTHHTESVMEAAGFFACTARFALDGCEPLKSLELALGECGGSPELRKAITDGINSRDTDTRKAIKAFGQQCDITAALPSTIHLLARYEEDLKEALIENAMAGGDSATRGMLAGLVLGASQGIGPLPSYWFTEMVHGKELQKLLDWF